MSNKNYKNKYRKQTGLNRKRFTNAQQYAVKKRPTNKIFNRAPYIIDFSYDVYDLL